MLRDVVTHINRPSLQAPFMVLAFSGWSDAGNAASSAVQYLIDQLLATELAQIDPEEFYDFSVQRPQVRLIDNERHIEWPSYDFYFYEGVRDLDQDYIFASGAEPHLRWKSFCQTMVELAREWQVGRIITLGALLDEVLYTKPVPLNGFSTDPSLIKDLDITPSQGPTGIIGALGDAFRNEGIPHMSLWGALPHYLAPSPNPRGTLALVLRLTQWLGIRIDTGPLERAAGEFQNKVNEVVNSDPHLSALVRELQKHEFEQ
jgi:proteasome assembly chaperone (PAC2) family protein